MKMHPFLMFALGALFWMFLGPTVMGMLGRGGGSKGYPAAPGAM